LGEYQHKLQEFATFRSLSLPVRFLISIIHLTLLIILAFGSIASGGLITAFGHYAPLLLGGGAISTVGMGLIYTLQIGTKSSHWIGYQVLTGFGVGFAFQIPQIVAQSICEISEVSEYTATSLCKLPAPNIGI
jgi:hypothetical protein